jgi:long-chain acyl-CoA synthetase
MLKVEDYVADWPDIDYPSFSAWLGDIEERWPDRIAIRYRTGKQKEYVEWTYQRLADESRRVGRALLGQGLKKGDRVALWAENRPEWCAVWIGAIVAGLVIVPMDAQLGNEDAAGVLKLAKPRVLFLSSRKADAVPLLKSHAASVESVVFLDGEGPGSFEALGRAPDGTQDSALPALPPPSSFSPDDSASIIFTSGTTGLAKGVVLSHHGIISNANASILSLPIWDRDVFMTVLPLHHSYPTTCSFVSPLCVGASFTIVEKLVGKVVIDDIRDSRGTILIAVPILYDKIKAAILQGFKAKGALVAGLLGGLTKLSLTLCRVGLPGVGYIFFRKLRNKLGLGTIRLMVAGGGPLNPATADFFDALGFYIVQGYGMSENGPLITTNTMRHKNNASAGLVVKYTDIKLLDPNPQGVGEITVKSPSLMKGYFENPEATAEVFTPDGYLKTGDLGYFDEDGFLFISGRKKNIIVTGGGKNIYPEEIEAFFEGSRVAQAVLVVGRRKRDEAAEEVLAVVHPDYEAIREDNPGAVVDDKFVESLVKREVQAVNRRLPQYKKISDFTVRKDEFVTTATKKIKRYLYTEYSRA